MSADNLLHIAQAAEKTHGVDSRQAKKAWAAYYEQNKIELDKQFDEVFG